MVFKKEKGNWMYTLPHAYLHSHINEAMCVVGGCSERPILRLPRLQAGPHSYVLSEQEPKLRTDTIVWTSCSVVVGGRGGDRRLPHNSVWGGRMLYRREIPLLYTRGLDNQRRPDLVSRTNQRGEAGAVEKISCEKPRGRKGPHRRKRRSRFK